MDSPEYLKVIDHATLAELHGLLIKETKKLKSDLASATSVANYYNDMFQVQRATSMTMNLYGCENDGLD